MYFEKETVTLTLGATGLGSAYSTKNWNGNVHSIQLQINGAAPSSATLHITGATTGNVILTVKNPSSLPVVYYPRRTAQSTTGGAVSSSTPVGIPVVNERIKLNMTPSSSGLGGKVVTAIFTVGG